MTVIQARQYRFWAVALGILLTAGVLAQFGIPGFWSSYALDIAAPAWIYIGIRGLARRSQSTRPPWFLPPETVLFFIISVCFLVEAAQFLGLSAGHYDPYDLLAYVALLVPFYIIDRWLLAQRGQILP